MKGEVSSPYFCGLPDHQFGRRRAFDVAVQFRFQNHAHLSPSRIAEARPFTAAARLDNSARYSDRLWSRRNLRRITIMSEQRTTAAGGMETSYGFRQVGAGDKQPLVNEVFHRVADRYDLMNDLMSAGMHRLWKDALVAWLNPPKRAGWKVLDVAGGTGDIAFRIVEASRRQRPCHRARHQRLDARRRPRARRQSGARRQHRFRRGQCRGTAFRRRHVRRLYDRLRHPQRAAHRRRARRGVPRAEARRPLPLPGILRSRHAAARQAPTRHGRSTPSRASARWSPATASPTPISSNRSANSPTSRISRR